MPDNAREELLTTEELAEWVKLAPGTIRNRVSAGTIPFVKVGGSIRFRRSEIVAWMESHRAPAEEGAA